MQTDVIARDAAAICERVKLDALRDKTILVTGASGLLGTYFLATLAHLKQSGVPLQASAQVRSEPEPHTTEILRRGGFQCVRANLAEPADCVSLPAADVIIHSAGYAQPAIFMANPVATFLLNTTATAALLQKLKPGGAFLIPELQWDLQWLEEIAPFGIRHRHHDTIASAGLLHRRQTRW